ncbi:hypothetical protein HYT01_03125 [Candidatus Giovannonibacteria bacterium]|nr:hypothetical protein [Candidatus Giovannonibacteria bacterium]
MDLGKYRGKRRKNKFIKKTVLALFTVILSAGGIIGLFWIPYFRISAIETSGPGESDAIKTALQPLFDGRIYSVLPQDNFFLFKSPRALQTLNEKELGVAQVSKKFPHTLSVKFFEESPWLLWCFENSCFYVNNKGEIYERAPQFSESPLPRLSISAGPSLKIGNKIADESVISFLHVVMDGFTGLGISQENIELVIKEKEVKFFTRESWYLYTDFTLDPERTFEDFRLLLSEKIKEKRADLEYVDMRFKDKAFYKFK